MSSSVSENQGNTVACTLLDEGAVERVSRRVANRVISSWVSGATTGLAAIALGCAICVSFYVLGHADVFHVFDRPSAASFPDCDTMSPGLAKLDRHKHSPYCPDPEPPKPEPRLMLWKYQTGQAVKKKGSSWGGVVQAMSHINGRTVYEVYSGMYGARTAYDETELELWEDYPEVKFKTGDRVRITTGPNKGRTGRISERRPWVPPQFGIFQMDDDEADVVLTVWPTQLELIEPTEPPASHKYPLGTRVRVTGGPHEGKAGTIDHFRLGHSGYEPSYGIHELGEEGDGILEVKESDLVPDPQEPSHRG